MKAPSTAPAMPTESIALPEAVALPEPETPKDRPVPRDWKASLYGGFTAKSGNTVENAYRYGGDFSKKNGKLYRYRLKVDGKYRKTEERVSDSKAEMSGEMRRLIRGNWFASGRSSVLHDDLKDLSYRAKLGPGIGYYFIQSEEFTADVSSGPMYVRERTSDGVESYMAWRVGQELDWRITQNVRWWTSTELVMDMTEDSAYTIGFQSGIENRLTGNLALTVTVEDEYDSQPDAEAEIKKNDFEVSTGLRYTF
jgi:putative salt-induced outer membrane protein YdiY